MVTYVLQISKIAVHLHRERYQTITQAGKYPLDL